MNKKVEVSLEYEANVDRISVPTPPSLADRYRAAGIKLQSLGKRRVLTKLARQALEQVVVAVEQAIENEQSKHV